MTILFLVLLLVVLVVTALCWTPGRRSTARSAEPRVAYEWATSAAPAEAGWMDGPPSDALPTLVPTARQDSAATASAVDARLRRQVVPRGHALRVAVTALHGADAGELRIVDGGPVIEFGSDAACDVVLAGMRARHLVARRAGDQVIFRDRSGTGLNGATGIHDVLALPTGAVIDVAGYRFEVLA
jgi:hypothetical protein